MLREVTVIVTGLVFLLGATVQAQEPPKLITRPQNHFFNGGGLRKASDEYTLSMHTGLKRMIDLAIQGGASEQISWLNLSKLKEEISEVTLYENLTSQAYVGAGGRIGSVHLVEQKRVYLNSALLSALSSGYSDSYLANQGADIIVFHEHVSALGYPDDNKEISTYLWMRGFIDQYDEETLSVMERAVVNHLNNNPRRTSSPQFEHRLQDGGTSTGIGGGGDPASAALKAVTIGLISANRGILEDQFGSQELSRLIEYILLGRVNPMSEKEISLINPTQITESDIRVQIDENGPVVMVNTNFVFKVNSVQDHVDIMYLAIKRFQEASQKDLQ